MYGAWIKADGGIIDCPDKMSHSRYCGYSDAYDEGWIAVVYGHGCHVLADGSYFGDSYRLEPETVTTPAIMSALKLIRKSGEDTIFLSDLGMNKLDGFTAQGAKKREAIDFLRGLRK